MLLFDKECTCFKSNNTNFDLYSMKVDTFENFLLEDSGDFIIKGFYNWIDFITYRDKVINKTTKKVLILFFRKQSLIYIFSNSESDSHYVKTKISKNFDIDLEKVELFNLLKAEMFNGSKCSFNLVNLLVNKNVGVNNKLITFEKNDLSDETLKDMLEDKNLCSLGFRDNSNRLYFNVDKTSTISFSDTSNLSQINEVIKNVNECFSI